MRHLMRPRASSLVDVKAVPRPILRTRPSSLAGPRGLEPLAVNTWDVDPKGVN